jgi:hypothetical protein
VHDAYLYYASSNPAPGGGFSVVINPSVAPKANEVKYPKLGMTWEFADHIYVSTPAGLKTGFLGYLTATALLFAVPTGLIFARPMPDILVLAGSALSWISFLIGIGLFLILGASILNQQKKK